MSSCDNSFFAAAIWAGVERFIGESPLPCWAVSDNGFMMQGGRAAKNEAMGSIPIERQYYVVIICVTTTLGVCKAVYQLRY